MTLKDNVLLGSYIINQKIKQKVGGIEIKTQKDATELHFDVYQMTSLEPETNHAQMCRSPSSPSAFYEVSQPRSKHPPLGWGVGTSLCLDCCTLWDLQLHHQC